MAKRPVTVAVVVLICAGLVFLGWGLLSGSNSEKMITADSAAQPAEVVRESHPQDAAVATFAGGCFWCTEAAFQETPGVFNAISGYAGGAEFDPTYEAVYTGTTGHREALRVYYDPFEVSYDKLLDVFWKSIDPTDPDGQFADRGMPYTAAIFYHDGKQRKAAGASRAALDSTGKLDGPVVTELLAFSTFYEAEAYHQDFYLKSSGRYKSYAGASGREEFKEKIWGQIQDGS
jgi:peptide methionine sulfoxide reductase msrA/msrB